MRATEREARALRANRVARIVVDAAIKVHRALGPGMLESAYEAALAHELGRRGLSVRTQVPIDIRYEDLRIVGGFRADLIVDQIVLVELKALAGTLPVHKRQTITYLRFTGLPIGLLLNFGAPTMKDGITRLVHRL
ncbi:MAG: GxxExxY protein [Sandaracinaceae bacterium]|nr:GxxExxY protein [Sandaracinaceae bacterium]